MDNIKLIIEKYDSSPLGWSKWLSSKKELLEELNSVLPEIKNNNEKIYWLKNGLKEYPKCPVCGAEIKKWCGRSKGGYFKFCSCKCAQNNEAVRNKMKNTCLKKYGVDNAAKSDLVQNKMKNTCLKKYGAENIFGSEIGKNKIKESMKKKYGVENPQQLKEIREKTKLTLLKKYNVTCGFHLTKDYKVSKGEIELYEFIKEKNSDAIHNDRTVIFPLELDIYLTDKKIGIEYDGDYWHNLPDMKKRDSLKNRICKDKGIKLIRVKESEWQKDKQKIKLILEEEINGSKKTI